MPATSGYLLGKSVLPRLWCCEFERRFRPCEYLDAIPQGGVSSDQLTRPAVSRFPRACWRSRMIAPIVQLKKSANQHAKKCGQNCLPSQLHIAYKKFSYNVHLKGDVERKRELSIQQRSN